MDDRFSARSMTEAQLSTFIHSAVNEMDGEYGYKFREGAADRILASFNRPNLYCEDATLWELKRLMDDERE